MSGDELLKLFAFPCPRCPTEIPGEACRHLRECPDCGAELPAFDWDQPSLTEWLNLTGKMPQIQRLGPAFPGHTRTMHCGLRPDCDIECQRCPLAEVAPRWLAPEAWVDSGTRP